MYCFQTAEFFVDIGIMEKNPENRLTVDQIANHDWLKAELPRDPYEVPIIPFVDPDADESITPSPMRSASPRRSTFSSNASQEEEDFFRLPPPGHISNPNFAYDSTLAPYLELMFEDLPQISRRSSASRVPVVKTTSFSQRIISRLRTPSTQSRPATGDQLQDSFKSDGKGHVKRTPSNTSNRSRPMTPFFQTSEKDRCKVQ
jgi:hypothetical protein